VVIRIYILEASGLPKMDLGVSSDPYLILKLGNSTLNDLENCHYSTINPKFYR